MLALGERLPSSRVLASDIGVSRNLVTSAYEQLAAEGYLEATVGRGTFVAVRQSENPPENGLGDQPSSGGSSGLPAPAAPPRFDFIPGRPDLSHIPVTRWNECLRDGSGSGGERTWGYGDAAGDPGLKEGICDWLNRIRGFAVHPDRVIVTSGTAQSLLLLALTLKGFSKENFYCENPSIPYARNAFTSAGFRIRALPAGRKGPGQPEEAGVVYLTPSHRFPQGGILPAHQRQEFISWAREQDSLIIEDDYDAEFRYAGSPVEPMVCIDPHYVVYLGTFSKCLFPGLRLGWMIVPDRLLPAIHAMKNDLYMRSPLLLQKAMRRFLEQGYLDRHVLAMKKIYRSRRDRITAILDEQFPGGWESGGKDAGYHLSITIPGIVLDDSFFRRCSDEGIAVRGEGHYSFGGRLTTRNLLIGYGNIRDDRLDEGMNRLLQCLPGTESFPD